MNFIRKPIFKTILIIIILIIIFWVAWSLWLGEIIRREKTISIVSEWKPPGYEMTKTEANKDETTFSYKPKDHEDKDIQRVVGDVSVRIKTYPTPEEAQQQIENASLVYIWEWRKEKILDHQFEVHTGFLFSPEERRYKEAYLAWIENGTTYYEFIARPADIRDYSDKEYLFESAKEVAETILAENE